MLFQKEWGKVHEGVIWMISNNKRKFLSYNSSSSPNDFQLEVCNNQQFPPAIFWKKKSILKSSVL